MFIPIVCLALLFQADTRSPQAQPPASQAVSKAESEPDRSALLKIKRIYVDTFGENETAREAQSMVVSALVTAKQFTVTENRDRADAILKGVASEKTSQELHAYSEGTAVGSRHGAAAIKDSSANTETIHEARIAVRLVTPDGDVIWTTAQESNGGKYKGATSDAADKCIKQLLKDIEKLKNSAAAPVPAAPSNSTDEKK